MLYAGKRPNEMTGDELEAAEALAIDGMRQANQHYEINRAAYQEVTAEQSRRLTQAAKLN